MKKLELKELLKEAEGLDVADFIRSKIATEESVELVDAFNYSNEAIENLNRIIGENEELLATWESDDEERGKQPLIKIKSTAITIKVHKVQLEEYIKLKEELEPLVPIAEDKEEVEH